MKEKEPFVLRENPGMIEVGLPEASLVMFPDASTRKKEGFPEASMSEEES